MFQLRRRGQVAYEDLLRELEMIERRVMSVDGSLAMELMVLDAKIRDRFQRMELTASTKGSDELPLAVDQLTMDDIRAMIPQDLPPFPTLEEIDMRRTRKNTIETVGLAAGLAVLTALGVFGLASFLQFALSWFA